MKFQIKCFAFLVCFFSSFVLNSQAVKNTFLGVNNTQDGDAFIGCGDEFIRNSKSKEYKILADDMIYRVASVQTNNSRSRSSTILKIPVVFHVVYNNSSENIADSVINSQMVVLNESFRRQNADTVNLRSAFNNLVGDTKIEFELATLDPNGNLTNGITRTATNIQYFGGVLPYMSGQNAQISNWVNDSLLLNYYRITDQATGGSDSWDPNRYLNIWIGDLRLFEPHFNNFKELVYLALASPPNNHPNWPDSVVGQQINHNQGVLMHYVSVGDNNPNNYPVPYTSFTSTAKGGKLMAHEVGHYLGLRHIWGDGDCTKDDFINDTPLSDNSSQWTCNNSLNSCVDNIGGVDLPNMIENYMDYSANDCQNSFTIEQGNLMRNIIQNYRPGLIGLAASISKKEKDKVLLYPNPTTDKLFVNAPLGQVTIFNSLGKKIKSLIASTSQFEIDLSLQSSGLYYLVFENGISKKVIKR